MQLVSTTQTVADDTATTDVNEVAWTHRPPLINDARTYDEISYVAEASLTGVCRLNRCWSLRGGYQVLWMTELQLADSAFTGARTEQTTCSSTAGTRYRMPALGGQFDNQRRRLPLS